MKWIWKVVFSTITNYIRYKGEVNFFIREFWKSFSDFDSDFIVATESFYKRFLRSFSSKQVFPIIANWVQCNFIYLLWLTLGKSSFLQNIVEEIRPGCRNLQRSQIMVHLSEMFLGGMNFFYRNGGGILLLLRCSQA